MKRVILPVVIFCILFLSPFIINAEEISDVRSDTPKEDTFDIIQEENNEPVQVVSSEPPTEDDNGFDLDKYIEETKEKIKHLDFDELKDKIKDPETGHYNRKSVENYLNTADDLMDEFSPGRSPLSIVLGPKGHYFKKVKFACPGDYEASGVYWVERDLNSYNGAQWKWSKEFGRQQRTMTNEIEAFMYHDLILSPRFEFANGLVTLHTQFKHGGYMWELAFPNYRFEDEAIYGSYAQKTQVDTNQLRMTALALEMVTPFGYGLIGKLPDPAPEGLSGMTWVGPLPPIGEFIGGFGLIYGKVLEGMVWDEDRKAWEAWGWDYLEVQNSDGYKDDDDCTLYGIGAGGMHPFLGGTLAFGGAYGMVIGGDESTVMAGMDLHAGGGGLFYSRRNFSFMNMHINKLKISTLGLCAYGTLLDVSPSTYVGGIIESCKQMFQEAILVMDQDGTKYRDPKFMDFPYIIEQDPVVLLASHAQIEIGDFTPEACIIYAQGSGETWQIPMIIPGAGFQSKGNKTPQGMLKSYLLNEVERKYFTLIGTLPMSMTHLGIGALDMFATNMTAVKAGSGYRISRHFSFYGQALAAWRNNVDYYKEDYWDDFILVRAFNTMEIYLNDDNVREIRLAALFMLKNQDYYLDEVDNFLGTELDSKLTYHVREGLDISLIAAYFKPGRFYEDILTPKRYTKVIGTFSDISGEIAIDSENEEDLYGPYEACRFFKLADAYTFQLMFDLKWD